MSPVCARCELQVKPGDLVTDLRVVTSHPLPDGAGVWLATDRTDRVVHVRCPGEEPREAEAAFPAETFDGTVIEHGLV